MIAAIDPGPLGKSNTGLCLFDPLTYLFDAYEITPLQCMEFIKSLAKQPNGKYETSFFKCESLYISIIAIEKWIPYQKPLSGHGVETIGLEYRIRERLDDDVTLISWSECAQHFKPMDWTSKQRDSWDGKGKFKPDRFNETDMKNMIIDKFKVANCCIELTNAEMFKRKKGETHQPPMENLMIKNPETGRMCKGNHAFNALIVAIAAAEIAKNV